MDWPTVEDWKKDDQMIIELAKDRLSCPSQEGENVGETMESMTSATDLSVRLLDLPMTVLRIEPGDVIVIMCDDDAWMTDDAAARVLMMIREAFPGHTILPLLQAKLGVIRPAVVGLCGIQYHAKDCTCQGAGGVR